MAERLYAQWVYGSLRVEERAAEFADLPAPVRGQLAVFTPLLFGMIGTGMFMYGKKAGRMVPLGAGLALMVVPMFISNLVVMLVVCAGLTASPWIIRE